MNFTYEMLLIYIYLIKDHILNINYAKVRDGNTFISRSWTSIEQRDMDGSSWNDPKKSKAILNKIPVCKVEYQWILSDSINSRRWICASQFLHWE